jgi:DNA invertase Pin-like site-specific DNA recombinase
LRSWCEREGWEIHKEYMDEASAADFVKRKAWAQLMKDASLRKFQVVLVWDMTRAFRRVSDGVNTMESLKVWGVGFKTLKNPEIDSTSPMAVFMMHILLAAAQFEREFMIVRINEGIAHARAHGTKSGKAIGRPHSVIDLEKVFYALTACYGNRSATARMLTKELGRNITAAHVSSWAKEYQEKKCEQQHAG